jgi:hypothetical protein
VEVQRATQFGTAHPLGLPQLGGGQVDGVHQGVEDRRLGGVIIVGLLADDLRDRLGLLELFEARRGLGTGRRFGGHGRSVGPWPRGQGVKPVCGRRGWPARIGFRPARGRLQLGCIGFAANGESLGRRPR